MSEIPNTAAVFAALKFAAFKHRTQTRKNVEKTPYINHPIEVAEILIRVAKVRDTETILAAVLHDTVEDTDTTKEELIEHFGSDVAGLVMECTDDKNLPKAERKRLQIDNASHKSPRARLIKIADKISNITDMANTPPPDWSLLRRVEYLDWAAAVVAGLRGENSELDKLFDSRLAEAKDRLAVETGGLC
ncbi:MAG: HD domain-containing protein [Candidatus Obscuribacterales bacterium]|nr:HD domain-containing protein [Candidatus Obscuribacterales bacterium]